MQNYPMILSYRVLLFSIKKLWLLSNQLKEECKAHPKVTSSREVLPIFMEGHSHNSVCCVEGLLHSISMVDVYVDVQHPLVVPDKEGHRQSSDEYKHCIETMLWEMGLSPAFI